MSKRYVVVGDHRIGWYVIDTEDGNRTMDDRPDSKAEAKRIAKEYEEGS